jgi:hypothetical protein
MFPSPPLPYYPIDLVIPFKLEFVKIFLIQSVKSWEFVAGFSNLAGLGED